jgi:hypothetical protein
MAKRKHKSDLKKSKGVSPLDPKSLSRFAGSSDEEAGHDDSGVEVEEEDRHAPIAVNKKGTVKRSKEAREEQKTIRQKEKEKSKRVDADHVQNDPDELEHDSDDDEYIVRDDDGEDDGASMNSDSDKRGIESGDAAMASVMARILGTNTAPHQSAVLSKTVTPLQKMAMRENEEKRQLRERRKLNREKQLLALHRPLSVATSAKISTPSNESIAKELEQERAFRRVATRGVVALFNAIAKHQKKADDVDEKEEKGNDTKKLTKQSFLEMIRNKALSRGSGSVATATKSITSEEPKWNALNDDYMLDSTKNWEEESSNESGDEDKAKGKKHSRSNKRSKT